MEGDARQHFLIQSSSSLESRGPSCCSQSRRCSAIMQGPRPAPPGGHLVSVSPPVMARCPKVSLSMMQPLFAPFLIIPLLSFPKSKLSVTPEAKHRELTTRFTVFSFLLSPFMCNYLLLRVLKYIIHAFDLCLVVVFSGRDRAQTPWTVCSLSGSFVHGILQARILEWVAIPFSRGSPQPRD